MSILIRATYTGKNNDVFDRGREYDLRIEEPGSAVTIRATLLKRHDGLVEIDRIERAAQNTISKAKQYSSLAEFLNNWNHIEVKDFI